MDSSKTEAPVTLRVDEAVAWLTLNRPAVLNVLDNDMASALRDHLALIERDPSIRAVVLAGAGRAFMAGGDIALFHRQPDQAAETAETLIGLFHEVIQTLHRMEKPVIASLHGAVAGGGMSLALACDLALAADDMRMTMAYTAIGTTPDGGGTFSLPRLVGARQALAITLLNEPITAEAAAGLGLVHRVVPRAALAAETERLAKQLAKGPTAAFGRSKRLIRDSFTATLDQQLEAERRNFVASAGTRDFREGIAAFFERRPAKFEGR